MSTPPPGPTTIRIIAEDQRLLELTVTSELLELLNISASINRGSSKRFDLGFKSLIAGFYFGKHRISAWFQRYADEQGAGLKSALGGDNLSADAIESLPEAAVASEAQSGFTATASAYEWLDHARSVAGDQKHEWTGLRHVMAALIFDRDFHASELSSWGFDREAWGRSYLQYVAGDLPGDLRFYQSLFDRAFYSSLDIPQLPLTDQAASILKTADKARRDDKRDRIYTEYLVRGLFESGLTLPKMADSLNATLDKVLRQAYYDSTTSPLTYAQFPVSENALGAIQNAMRKAGEQKAPAVDETHLAFGVLSQSSSPVVRELNALGLTPDKVYSGANRPAPNTTDAAPQQQPIPPGDAGRGLIAAYQSEEWTGPDLLDTTRDVNALSALVAGWNVQPPLSIGLFGEWGSGKSFFMRQMRTRVKSLALAAQASGKPQRECAYYKNIAQIEFNAWHYMEGDNLWACLVQHIFSNLRFPQDTTSAQVQARQKQILEQIGAKKILEAQVEKSKAELEIKRTDAENKARVAGTKLNAAQTALEQEKSALGSRITVELSADIKSVIASIPEAVRLSDDVENVRRLSEEARGLTGRIRLLWDLLRHDPQRRAILCWMLGGSAILFALGQLPHWFDQSFGIFSRADLQGLVSVATALAGTAIKFRPVLAKITHAVSLLEEKNHEITKAISEAEKKQQQQIARLEDDVRALTEQIDQAEKEQQQHQQAIDRLEKELAETDASRLLSEFIRSRADADDYSRHLGIVALVRRDFERLSDFFRSQREAELSGRDRVDNSTVNRIVLYIDDLDRCPPETVVKTLQAIHLLLAFPIFVVVVAVDARWVSRSLEQCYDWLVPETQPAAQPVVAVSGAERVRSATNASAHDYLEKIFQIPFWLAPMTSQSCQTMIRGLTAAIAREQSALKQSVASAAGRQLPATPTSAADPLAPAPETSRSLSNSALQPGRAVTQDPAPVASAPLTVAMAADEIDLHPRQLDIEEAEIKKIDELAVLIGRSPRVAKRFLNCYRMIKARMTPVELDRFLDGSFQDVIEILAIIVGAPSVSHDVVEALSMEDSARDGSAFLTDLAKRLSPTALAGSDGVEVARLLSAATAEHLKSLRAVAPLVSRFSFATQTGKSSADEGVRTRKSRSATA